MFDQRLCTRFLESNAAIAYELIYITVLNNEAEFQGFTQSTSTG
jgi:hypothetical protein